MKLHAKGKFAELTENEKTIGWAVCLNDADIIKKYSHVFCKVTRIIFDEFHTPGMEGLSFESFKGARGASCTNARDDFHSRFPRKGKHDDAMRRGSILYKVLCPGHEGARFPRPGSGQDEQVFSCERDSGALLCIQFFLKMVCAELVGGIFGFVCDFCIRHRGPRGKDVRPNVRPDAFERIII